MSKAYSETVKLLADGIGALCEVSGVMLKELKNNGFSRQEAVQIVTDYLIASTTRSDNTKEEK